MLALFFAPVLFSLADSIQVSDVESLTHPEDSAADFDHNGRKCRVCGKPLPERLAKGKKYKQFRTDCGEGASEWTGLAPVLKTILTKRLNDYNKDEKDTENGLPMNAFCALNLQKSCADAIANKDYMYYAKGLSIPNDRNNKKYDWSYCVQNGWLDKEVVDLAHSGNFLMMQRFAKEQCTTKYEKYNWRKITLAKFGLRYVPGVMTGTNPSEFAANYIGAWNCAMGDAACAMTYCAYTYCNLGDGKARSYDECPDWDPVKGMRP